MLVSGTVTGIRFVWTISEKMDIKMRTWNWWRLKVVCIHCWM